MKILYSFLVLSLWLPIICQAQNNDTMKYDYEEKFSEGLKAVGKGDKLGYVDATGKIVIDFQFEYQFVLMRGFLSNEEFAFREGLARVKKNKKWGFIDKTGKTVIDFQYLEVGSFKEGIASARTDKGWGFIDKTGKVVIDFQFYNVVSYFSEGKARYKEVKNGRIYEGFINRKGEKIIPAQFNSAQRFSEGLASVSKGNGWGFIDEKGKIIIPYQFDWVEPFKNGKAKVTFYTETYPLDIKEIYFIDKKGKRISD